MVLHVLSTTCDTEQPFNLEKVIDIKKFSSLTKLLRVTAFVSVSLIRSSNTVIINRQMGSFCQDQR